MDFIPPINNISTISIAMHIVMDMLGSAMISKQNTTPTKTDLISLTTCRGGSLNGAVR